MTKRTEISAHLEPAPPPLPHPDLLRILSPAYEPCPGFQGACRAMRWIPADGHVPRGFAGATGSLDEVRLVLVTAEPGDPHMDERYTQGPPSEVLAAAARRAYEAFRTGRDLYHRNLRYLLDGCFPGLPFDQQMRHTWITDAVLCSADREGLAVSRAIELECRSRYLEAQLRLFPSALVVTLGGKARYRLRDWPGTVTAFSVAPPGSNYSGARPSWDSVIAEFHARRLSPQQTPQTWPTRPSAYTPQPMLEISGISERDVDLVILEELSVSPRFRERFLAAIGLPPRASLVVEKAVRSATDSIGESDLLVRMTDDERTIALFIENKVFAAFQPDQAERYQERAQAARMDGVTQARTVLVAPARYASGDTRGFDARVDYEDMIAWLREEGDPRSHYRAELLELAVARGQKGYHPIGDDAVSRFWSSYWSLAKDYAPRLGMAKPKGKPSGAGFVYFTRLGLPSGVTLVHKLRHGVVDLQFAGWASRLGRFHELLGPHLEGGMYVVAASGSAAVRIDVEPLRPAESFAEQAHVVVGALNAATTLLSWALARDLGPLELPLGIG